LPETVLSRYEERSLEVTYRSIPRALGLLIFLSILAMIAPLALGGCGSKTPSTQPEATPVVKKVDHVTISCTDPQALFNTFTQTLGLPVAWSFSAYPGFSTGGVYAGNVNLETLKFDAPAGGQPAMPPLTFIYGIVFESYPLDQVTSEFAQRGADPGAPQDQMREMNGQQVKVWTNVTLQALCTQDYIVYLCEYTPEMQAALASRAGASSGPLGGIGLTGVKEIDIVSTQPDQTRELWQTVFAPAPMSADGVQAYDAGPAVRISQGSDNFIEGMVFEVASLQAARDFLSANGLLGSDAADQISINPAAVQGLDIRLVQRKQ
jgi:catechol 2,3-dioxygenase-like lactoylglutathione lyase family enzyme